MRAATPTSLLCVTVSVLCPLSGVLKIKDGMTLDPRATRSCGPFASLLSGTAWGSPLGPGVQCGVGVWLASCEGWRRRLLLGHSVEMFAPFARCWEAR